MKIHGNISPVTEKEFSVNEETSENSDSSHSPNSLKSMQPISSPCSSEPDSPPQELPTVSSTASPTLPIHPTVYVFSHPRTRQQYGLSLVWTWECFFLSELLANLLSHPGNSHGNGFSPKKTK
jgi:hypothetical protein